MAVLGKINPVKRMACPECKALLPDWTIEEILATDDHHCPGCGQPIQLPAELLDRARKSQFLGKSLDITA